jgi:ER membrane protein SH3
MIFVGLAGLVTKLYKPSESNMLFDGGSLVLYMCGVIVYGANIIKGLRIATQGTYGKELGGLDADDVDAGGQDEDGRVSVVGREDNLKVLSASNTILALVLVGVLILQAGQWYAERADEKEKVKIREQEEKEKVEREEESEGGSSGAAVGRRPSGREGKKTK